jgi:hypothetical protein
MVESRAKAAFVFIALLLVQALSFGPATSANVGDAGSESCDATAKPCQPIWPLGAPSESGFQNYQFWMNLLGPYLDRDTELLLRSVWPHEGLPPPVDLPPRPQGIGPTNVSVSQEFRLPGVVLTVNASARSSSSVPLVASGGQQPFEQIPCTDSRGCPDLVVDASWLAAGVLRRETFSASDCNVLEGSVAAGSRRVLRFTTTVPNLGDGDLIVGRPTLRPTWFEWGSCHGHWHFRDYSEYRLWKPREYLRWMELRHSEPDSLSNDLLERHPEIREGFVAGHKQGFCVIDILPYLPVEPPKYWNCAHGQGISRGWADQYNLLLDGQFIDVSDLPPGPYVLEVEANPSRAYEEIDYGNNGGAMLVMIPPEP